MYFNLLTLNVFKIKLRGVKIDINLIVKLYLKQLMPFAPIIILAITIFYKAILF